MGGTASVAKTQAASKQVEHNERFFPVYNSAYNIFLIM